MEIKYIKSAVRVLDRNCVNKGGSDLFDGSGGLWWLLVAIGFFVGVFFVAFGGFCCFLSFFAAFGGF